jgi:DNA-binding response OmpR family regulator
MAAITVLGLDSVLAQQLSEVLRAQRHVVRIADTLEEGPCADIVFTNGDGHEYQETIRALARCRRHSAVVVVSRLPENGRWLNALEAGADDYCGAPFEPVMVQWLVESVLRRGPKPAAA